MKERNRLTAETDGKYLVTGKMAKGGFMTHTCNACDYTWTPRPGRLEQDRDKPTKCPRCQAKDWDKPRKE